MRHNLPELFSAPGTPSGKTTQDTRHMNTESTQPVLTAEGKPYIWGDDSFATLPQTEGAIAMYLASGSAFALVRFQTVKVWPWSIKRSAMALPIRPVPRMVIFIARCLSEA